VSAEPPGAPGVCVWDRLVRLLHWSLVASVALAWITSEVGRRWHEALGWAVVAIVALRLIWGLAGPATARFSSFVRGPHAVLAYAARIAQGRAPRYVGHNPLAGWMIVALLSLLAAISATGWLLTTDAFFGSEAMEDWHEVLAEGLLALVALHVAGVAFTSWHQGENLVRAMWNGRKRASAPGDID
jgi:cytochrome b